MQKYSLINFHPKTDQNPEHVGLIPDGTGCWAKANNFPLPEAYFLAMKKLVQYVSFFFDEGCQAVSIYGSSIQNFKRSKQDISAFCQAETRFCVELLPSIVEKYETKVKLAGNINVLPSYMRDAVNRLEEITSTQKSTRLYICAAYNPLEEILQAIQLADPSDQFLQNLWVPEPLDLVIRTGDANLLSNFLPLQSGYARFYVLKKLFMDTELEDFRRILLAFRKLVRSYGD